MRLAAANRAAIASGEGKLVGQSNYFVGHSQKDWRTGIPQFSRVKYKAVYPGIDVSYYGTNHELEYDFMVAPRGNPNLVRMQFTGQDRVEMTPAGDVLLHTGNEELTVKKPIAYQVESGRKREVSARFIRVGMNRLGIRLGNYDHESELIIDPKLAYSSYLGGTADEGIFGIGFDPEGNLYIAGETSSVDFPTKLSPQSKVGGDYDAFVSKFDRTGSKLIYSTYLGGSMYDHSIGIAVDEDGSAYVAGVTYSSDFPLAHPLQTKLAGPSNAFVARLSPSGSSLVFSTYLGGSGYDQASGITIDQHGNVYLAGSTSSTDFPTTAGSLQTVCDRGVVPGQCTSDGFVTKLNPWGSELLYSTYLGRAGYDFAGAVAVDEAGSAYVVGQTQSRDFPTKDAFQPMIAGFSDAFVTKLDAAGKNVIFSSYLGGNNDDGAYDVALDAYRNIYVTGFTGSSNFSTLHPFQARLAGQSDAFVTKVHWSGSRLEYSTYLGGQGYDSPIRMAVDGLGDAVIAGLTNSTDFPVANAIQAKSQGGFDAFVTRLDPSGSKLSYSTYLGGSGDEFGYAINTDLTGAVWVGGSTSSTNFPQQHPYQGKYAGGPFDAFLSKITLEPVDSLLVLEAGVSNLVVQHVIDEQKSERLLHDLRQARRQLLSGNGAAASDEIFAFERHLLEYVQNAAIPQSRGLALGLAGYDILGALGKGPIRD